MKLLLFLFIVSCSQAPVIVDQKPEPDIIVIEDKPTTPIEDDVVMDEPAINYTEIAQQVDSYYRMGELLKERGDTTFAKTIAEAVEEGMKDKVIPLDDYISGLFGVKTRNPVSFKTPLCQYDNNAARKLLKTTISNSGLALVNRFAKEVNEADEEGKQAIYTRLMMCLAYSESLSTADNEKSYILASREGVTKNDGVKFYFDSLQTNPDSQINIGLYQFSPIAKGNIHTCLNDFKNRERSRKDLVNLIGAKDQVWNARCGVHKVQTVLFVTLNAPTRNIGNQCGTFHALNTVAYNHFGPLQREGGVGGGFTKLYNCYYGSKR